jgi:NAD(P)-dependent dehydrogenase (short-subunit alcohol dehydrogenase family)
VVFGDVNVAAAEGLSASAIFLECDVTKYDDIYQLFKKTFDQFGHIDHAISCAGIFEQGNWFDPNYTIDNIKDDPGNTKVLDVNLTGTLHFARIAAVFLRESRQENSNKSLTLLSSVNAFRDSPGLYLYQTSKHAIQGILRSTRKTLHERDGIRVNAVCPGVTDTPMTAAIIQPFKDAGLFWQPAEAVAKVILGIMSSKEMNGKAFYVEGGDGFEFEDSLYAAQPQWLGEEATRRMRVNTEAVQKVKSRHLSAHKYPSLQFTGRSYPEVRAMFAKVKSRRHVTENEKIEPQLVAMGTAVLVLQTILPVSTTMLETWLTAPFYAP